MGPPRLDAAAVVELRLRAEREVADARLTDQRRLDLLTAAGYAGPAYQQFCEQLWIYALPVLKSKMRSGEIFTMCFDKGVILNPTFDERAVLHSSMEDRDTLAVDTIAAAIPEFRTTLIKRRWTPAGGSSVDTYFVGACLFAFGDVFRKWARTRRRHLAQILQNTEIDVLAGQVISTALDPERTAVTRDAVAAILRNCPPETRLICALIMRDLPFAEIATQLGITERAVEGRMRRLRRRVNRMIEQGDLDHFGHAVPRINAALAEPIVA
ncbi:MAG: RNA polymerase sigma factor [Thermoleophilia bacterium]